MQKLNTVRELIDFAAQTYADKPAYVEQVNGEMKTVFFRQVKEDVDALEKEQLDALETNREMLQKRQADGKIRECHGDLTLRNLAMWNGKVTPFNPIEFYADLTQIDTLYDFAFLVVDLESKGQRRLESILFNH